MTPTIISMNEDLREEICELLNTVLATIVDLKACVHSAHLNAKGPNFYSLHKMYDQFRGELMFKDMLGEVIVSLGGVAEVYPKQIYENSVCHSVPADITGEFEILGHILQCYGEARELIVEAVEELLGEDVQEIADVLMGIQTVLQNHIYIIQGHGIPIPVIEEVEYEEDTDDEEEEYDD